MQLDKHKKVALSLVGVVCDREKKDRVVHVLEGQRSFFNLATLGKGTANSKMLGYFGLGETEKTVFFCIMPTHIGRAFLHSLNEAMELSKPGHGVAFMARIHEGCYHKPVEFTGEDAEGEDVEQKAEHDVIMVVLNRGYTEDVMEVARAAGATGGTVLHARGCGLAGAEKFFGVTIQPEKEMIIILAGRDVSCAIMAAMGEKVGPGTDASAISFSMPASMVVGLSGRLPGSGQAE